MKRQNAISKTGVIHSGDWFDKTSFQPDCNSNNGPYSTEYIKDDWTRTSRSTTCKNCMRVGNKARVYYKVVSVGGGGNSLWSFTFDRNAAVTYKVGKETRPLKDNGPLAVFTSLTSAKIFLKGYAWWNIIYRIYECEIKESKEHRLYDGMEIRDKSRLPRGTVLADSVILTNHVFTYSKSRMK